MSENQKAIETIFIPEAAIKTEIDYDPHQIVEQVEDVHGNFYNVYSDVVQPKEEPIDSNIDSQSNEEHIDNSDDSKSEDLNTHGAKNNGNGGIILDNAIIREVSTVGREFLYDLGHKQYKNNCLKLKVWTEIGCVVGLHKNECQKIWRSLKVKYKAAIRKSKLKSGSAAKPKKPYTEWLLKEMAFMEKFVSDSEPTVSIFEMANFSDTSEDSDHLEQPSCSSAITVKRLPVGMSDSSDLSQQPSCSTKKKKKLEDPVENTLSTFIAKMENLENRLFATGDIDPFAVLIDKELKKVPDHLINDIKLSILQTIFSAQKKG